LLVIVFAILYICCKIRLGQFLQNFIGLVIHA
jgi:hypothetical protein